MISVALFENCENEFSMHFGNYRWIKSSKAMVWEMHSTESAFVQGFLGGSALDRLITVWPSKTSTKGARYVEPVRKYIYTRVPNN